MTDREAEKQKRRVLRVLKKWDAAGFDWWHRDVTWDTGDHSDCDKCSEAACCNVLWEYRDATFTFRLHKIACLDDDEMEKIVVHELSHLLVASIHDYSTEDKREKTEFAVTSVTQALLWASKFVR